MLVQVSSLTPTGIHVATGRMPREQVLDVTGMRVMRPDEFMGGTIVGTYTTSHYIYVGF